MNAIEPSVPSPSVCGVPEPGSVGRAGLRLDDDGTYHALTSEELRAERQGADGVGSGR